MKVKMNKQHNYKKGDLVKFISRGYGIIVELRPPGAALHRATKSSKDILFIHWLLEPPGTTSFYHDDFVSHNDLLRTQEKESK